MRFPEFSDVQEWKEIPMHQIGKTLTGLSGKNSSDFGCGKRYITYKQVYSDTVNDFDKCEKVFVNESEKQNCVQQGDVLFTTSSETPDEVGISSVILKPLPETIYLNSFCFILRPYDINNLYPQFAKYLFQSPTYRKRINKLAQGAIRFNLSKAQFISLSLPIPIGLNEQQKIADCLSSIDALIKAAENKIDELKAHKKGLMQQLFPAEGKMVPALRFPEFQNAGEWTKGPLSRIGDVLQGYGFPEKYQGKSLGKYPFYKVSDISKAFQTGCNFISKAVNYIDDEELDILKIKTTPPGTTIFARIGEAIRLNRRIVTTQECIIDNNTVGVKAIPENAIDLFVYYILLQVDLIDFAGGVVPAVTKSAIENIPIYCPPTKSEQKKIVDCLSSVDNLIIAQTNRLEALRNHKKGLMQQLFPNIDEC